MLQKIIIGTVKVACGDLISSAAHYGTRSRRGQKKTLQTNTLQSRLLDHHVFSPGPSGSGTSNHHGHCARPGPASATLLDSPIPSPLSCYSKTCPMPSLGRSQTCIAQKPVHKTRFGVFFAQRTSVTEWFNILTVVANRKKTHTLSLRFRGSALMCN